MKKEQRELPFYRQLQRGTRSAEGLTQRATFGAWQLTSQRRPPEFRLHEVVPTALPPLPPLSLLLLVVVLVTTLVALSPLVLLRMLVLLVALLLMLMLLEVESALAPTTATHSRRARGENCMMQFGTGKKRGRSPFFSSACATGALMPLYRCPACFSCFSSSLSCSSFPCRGPLPCPGRACRDRRH